MLANSVVITEELQELLREKYQLNWYGMHGFPHWIRVRENGLRLAEITGASSTIVEYFSFFHDICRWDNGSDLEHGKRAAEYITSLDVSLFTLSAKDLELLKYACANHTKGMVRGDITVQTCWDADRLDLGRVGINPDRRHLCTEAAKRQDILDWANQRSRDKSRFFS
jgi:uncharacterized protein